MGYAEVDVLCRRPMAYCPPCRGTQLGSGEHKLEAQSRNCITCFWLGLDVPHGNIPNLGGLVMACIYIYKMALPSSESIASSVDVRLENRTH